MLIMEVLLNNKHQFALYDPIAVSCLREMILEKLGFGEGDFYLTVNGKLLTDEDVLNDGRISIVPRLIGGKGGFGSMLRAIGAQIEKTTNREACRDLSGRRLRDINEEKRLKKWIHEQAEREKEALKRRQKKLEKMCEEPKFEFKDEQYEKERSILPDQVEDAVLQGLQASCSTKRKTETDSKKPKKKPKLWLDDELDDELSDTTDEDNNSDPEDTSKSSEIKQENTVVSSKSQKDYKDQAVEEEKCIKEAS